MKVQQQVPVCDGDKPPERAIRFRVGINVGDVIPDGTDIHGDVVNWRQGSRPNVRRAASAFRERCAIMFTTVSIYCSRNLDRLGSRTSAGRLMHLF